jgi:hypothetical protein
MNYKPVLYVRMYRGLKHFYANEIDLSKSILLGFDLFNAHS